jgi:hypothetical protein
MNVRSIKRRNLTRLKRSVGRGWSAAAVAISAFNHAVKAYNEWFNALLAKEFGLSRFFLSSAPDTPSVSNFAKLVDAQVVTPLLDAYINKEH